jgi:hypothetical protein
MKPPKQFPTGTENWINTHFMVSAWMGANPVKAAKAALDNHHADGVLMELAEMLTDRFQYLWKRMDGMDWEESINSFLESEIGTD